MPTAPAIFNELGPDVVHFLSQGAFRTNVPSLYHPHDLQHLHYPQYFTPRQRLCREVLYRAFCEQANVVPCASSWIKRDLVRAYELDDAKVAVVALAPPLAEYPTPSAQQCAELRTQHALAESFLLYPATTWQHKNHQALLRSAALLRKERGLELQLVFPGGKTGYRKQLERLASRLGVTDLVRYVGYVSETELAALYRMCTVVGIPTRFEAASFPLWEAFLAGKPTVCAHTTSLPEQAKDAAVFFDADSVPELTDGLWRILHDTPWCQELVRRGSERVQLFRWSRTVRHFRALYRHLGGAALTAEDRSLLQQQPLM